ncbi:MAG TPA: NAD(P)/FAD-dependent oxidoreductase [Mycobacteriales bacterium]|nr:NAD(P)/FAD-dependent oxidoreductase [Mycobacteriales bacterium]
METVAAPTPASEHVERVDVLVVGAGLSGIGAACHLSTECPDKTFAIVEAREASGGTWDLFRYPGIRSDSDMYTLGYIFRPWVEAKSIADGSSILSYIRETAKEYGVDSKIRYHRRVVRASWCSESSEWTVDIEHTDTGDHSRLRCNFLFCNTGYYRYDEGYTPEFPGMADYTGRVIHPQHWPADVDVTGQRVVVIGSGATAVTLVPALAETAKHVVMLQRSPTYIVSLPDRDPLASKLREHLPLKRVYSIVRWKNVILQTIFFQLCRAAPKFAAGIIRKGVEKQLPAGYDVATDFQPRYNPWDQRLCLVPNGDLFRAIRDGRACVVTDRIERITERGIRLESGRELEADVIITATGLNLQLLGGMTVVVDGEEIDFSQTVGYKGMMLSGVPNLVTTMGYTNASWTLKADLVATHVCRLLKHMTETGATRVVPRLPAGMQTQPFIDLNSGYVLRAQDRLPKQGTETPWRLHQNYLRDVKMLRYDKTADPALEFSRP